MGKFNARQPRHKFTEPEGKSKGILDDFAVRKNVASKEGTIEHTPTNDNHIANKKYVDDTHVPAGSTGEVQFNDAGSFGADSNLFWDNVNKRLGIGKVPSSEFDVKGTLRISSDTGYVRMWTVSTGSLWIKPNTSLTYFNGPGNNRFFAYDYTVGSPYPYLDLSAHWLKLNAIGNPSYGQLYFSDSADSYIDVEKNFGVGIKIPATSAKLDITSTTGALLLPRMTTTQKNALTAVNGMLLYDSTLNQTQTYENGAWRQI